MRTPFFIAAALTSGVAFSATPIQEQGRQIATNGAPNGIAACASCHGEKGEGNAAAGFPRIAGQASEYLSRQMTNFTNGSRNNPVMTPIAQAMSAQQIAAVSAYYAALDAPATTPAPPSVDILKRGHVLATVGDNNRRVQACANCHGPGGAGEPPIYPYLAGQHAAYLTTALEEWKSGARNTDPSGQMPTIAKLLTTDDVTAVALYYAHLPPPRPQAPPVVPSPSRPTTPRGPTTAVPEGDNASQPQGVGTEQGAPTTGGAQGAGGGGGSTGSGIGKPR